MANGCHLLPEARKVIDLTASRRIAFIQDDSLWIEYPQSQKVLRIVENMLAVPDRRQAPCLLVKGEGGTGKSSIIRQIKSNHALRAKLVFLDLNVNPFGLKFTELIAEALGVPLDVFRNSRRKPSDLPVELVQVLKIRGIKGFVIDELHDAMLVGRVDQMRHLSLLKGLTNDPLGLSIIGFGTSAVSNAIGVDPQFKRRFLEVELEDWAETEDFRSFLAGFEELLPLKHPSQIDDEETVGFLLETTGGRMDEVVKLLRAAACYAVVGGEEKITKKLLSKAFADPWGY
ncbi:TniB family NTP-binding protein [Pseudomonas sp. BN414]|uniref:TniB family NTP-binding protein n=1 Tax=Pseudomonas sp. BN414 TaxID=2567888 RepID=UPI002455BACC|nr:TniB family NTP-binding protein [Pseudomonas sp. BN414]